MHIFSKKIVTVLSISLFAALLVSCGSAQNSSKANQIEPLPETLSIDDINGKQVIASFEPSDVTLSDDGTLSVHFKVYNIEHFSSDDIANMKVGDTILLLGEEVKVDSLDRNDSGSVDINGGVEENGYYLAESLDGDGTYCQYFWDVQQNYYEIGAVSFDSAKDFEYIDQSAGPDDPDETYSASEFYNALQDSQESYSPYYTRVLIEENQISNITRVFVP